MHSRLYSPTGRKVLLLCLGLLVYGVTAFLHHWHATLKGAAVVSDLAKVRNTANRYLNDHGTLPREFAALGLFEGCRKDPFSGQQMTWMPGATDASLPDVLLIQPKAFRTALWPFGERRRYALRKEVPMPGTTAYGYEVMRVENP